MHLVAGPPTTWNDSFTGTDAGLAYSRFAVTGQIEQNDLGLVRSKHVR